MSTLPCTMLVGNNKEINRGKELHSLVIEIQMKNGEYIIKMISPLNCTIVK